MTLKPCLHIQYSPTNKKNFFGSSSLLSNNKLLLYPFSYKQLSMSVSFKVVSYLQRLSVAVKYSLVFFSCNDYK